MQRRYGLMVLAGLACAVTSCAASPAASTTPRASPSASHEPNASDPAASPLATMSPEPAGTPPITTDSVAAVVTNDLVVRTKPGTEVDSEILRPYLNAPQLLYVIGGPVTANGYEWYLVAPLFPDYLPHGEDPPSGWVAAGGKDGEAWIATSQLHCPQPNLHRIMQLSELARLACFGDRELTLQGTSSGCFVADPVTVEPQWLSSSGCNLKPDGYDPQSVPAPGPLLMRSAGWFPGWDYGEGGRFTITGRFDDPVATSCRSTPGNEFAEPPAPESVVLQCRTQFVVTGIEPR